MILDLISQKNNWSYNIEIAKKFGLQCAVYLSALISEYSKFQHSDKSNDNDHMPITRKKITDVTTLTIQEQRVIEDSLESLGIINVDNSGVSFDIFKLNRLMSTDDELKIDVPKALQEKKTKNEYDKRKGIVEKLKLHIKATDPNVRKAYFDWMESVATTDGGYFSKAIIEKAQTHLYNFANGNPKVIITILDIATIRCYKNIDWAISEYNKTKNKSTQNQVVSVKSDSVMNKVF